MANSNDVDVRFGAQTGNLDAALKRSGLDIKNFSADILKLNPQLAELANSMNTAAQAASGAAAPAMEKTGHAAAGVTREFIVLGHELVSGNFSRVPGSLMVLGERMGGVLTWVHSLSAATIGWTAAIAATVAATYEWITANEKLAETQQSVRGAMDLNNQSMGYNANQTEKNIVGLRLLGGMSTATASEIVTSFARAGEMSTQFKQKLISITADYAAATSQEAPKAAEDLIKMFSAPAKGAEELSRKFTGVLKPAQLETIEAFVRGGDQMKAQELLFDSLGAKIDGFRAQHLTPLQKALGSIQTGWVALTNPSAVTSLTGGQKFDSMPGLSADTSAAAAAQQHQNDLNQALMHGVDIEKQSGLLIAHTNELMERKAALIKAANAAGEQGNSSQEQRFLNDAREVQEQINALRTKGQAQSVEAEMAAVQTKVEISRIELEEKKDLLRAGVDANLITKTQEIAILKKFSEQEYQINLQALNDELDMSHLSIVERQRVNDEILKLQAQHTRDMAALDLQQEVAAKKSADEQVQAYRQVFDEIGSKFDSVFNGILQGTQTWQQATRRAAGDVLAIMIETAAKVAAAWSLSKLFNAEGWKEMASAVMPKGGGIVGALTGSGGSAAQTANTAALTGLNAQILALNTALGVNTVQQSTNVASNTLNTALNTSATVTNTSALAANGAGSGGGFFSWISSAIASVASFDVGSWSVPRTGLAMIHKDEMIVPAQPAGTIRSGSASLGGSAAGGGGNVTVNINAIDTQTGAQFLKQNIGVIAKGLSGQSRNFNPHIRP